MEKDVIISVISKQMDMYNEMSELELVTEGTYSRQDNAYFVTYKESEVTGMEGTTTILKATDDGVVTLTRTGSVNTHFIFQQGQRHMSHYDTEYGAFTLSIYAEEVDIRVNDRGGEIRVGYQMEIENTGTGINDFRMSIREAGKSRDKYHRERKTTNKRYS